MNQHIPEGHSGVKGYSITLRKTVLTKKTVLFEGKPHRKSFDLKNAVISTEYFKLEGEEADVMGFGEYWDVNINGDWITTELQHKKDVDRIVYLLEKIKELAGK